MAALRSYQEANTNYFDHLEQKVIAFAKAYHIDLSIPISVGDLEDILVEEYGYTINKEELQQYKELGTLRSVYVAKTKTLLLSNQLDDAQRTFIYAKELAYNFLAIEERLYTFPWIKFETFDQVLHNFYASYFAGALVIPKKNLQEKLEILFSNPHFKNQDFLRVLESFNASPESFYQRLTNILPKAYHIKNLFFLRFTHKEGSDTFLLKKELHLTHQHSPRANESNEHYCRRWLSLKLLKEAPTNNEAHLFGVQISEYPEEGTKYLIWSSVTKDPFKAKQYRSISIGLQINRHLEKKLEFLNDPTIPKEQVGVTCERCSINPCKQRQVPPSFLDKKARNNNTARVVDSLLAKYA